MVSAALVLGLSGCTADDSTATEAASTADMTAAASTADGVERAGSTVDVGSGVALTAAPSADVQPPMETEEPQALMATGAPEVVQDFEDDAGADIEEFDYPADPAPAESVVSTLCNLNRDYLSSLRDSSAGADGALRMASLSVSDAVGYWESLVPSYPEVADDVATAAAVQQKWDEALLASDNGDETASEAALVEADDLIATLPAAKDVDCVP